MIVLLYRINVLSTLIPKILTFITNIYIYIYIYNIYICMYIYVYKLSSPTRYKVVLGISFSADLTWFVPIFVQNDLYLNGFHWEHSTGVNKGFFSKNLNFCMFIRIDNSLKDKTHWSLVWNFLLLAPSFSGTTIKQKNSVLLLVILVKNWNLDIKRNQKSRIKSK